MEKLPKNTSNAEAAELLGLFCSQGLVLNGGFSMQFFLPKEFRKTVEDDIDFSFFHKGSKDEALERLNFLARKAGLSPFRELEHHSAQQPRRTVFESLATGLF